MIRRRSEFNRNIATLVTGTTLAQAIPVLISPALTRLYSPDDFGVFALYFSGSMILSVLATGKYEMAITLPADKNEADRLVQLSLLIAVVLSVSLGLFLIPLRSTLSVWLGIQNPIFFLFLPLSVLLIGFNQTLYYYLNRNKRYNKMATSRIIRSAGYGSVSLLMGIFKVHAVGLIISDLFGQIITGLYVYKSDRKKIILSFDFVQIKSVARKYINFPRYSIISGILEKLSGHSPVFLLTKLFLATNIVGFFSLAQRTIIAPSDLITRAISDVFRQQASESYAEKGECFNIFWSTFKKLALISIIPFFVGYFVIVDIFKFVFGAEWVTAGVYAQIMMPMFFLQFVVSPLSIVFFIAQKQKYDMILQTFLLVGVLIAFLISHPLNDVELSLSLFTGVYCVKYCIEFFLSYRFSKGFS